MTGLIIGRLKMSISPTGYWQRYQYDGNGWLTNAVSQFLGLGTNATDAQSRDYQYSYAPLDGASNTTTTVELLQGVEISRSYQLQWPTETILIQCQTAGASWTNTNNLVTTTLYNSDQSVSGAQIASVQYPDGTISSFTYANGVTAQTYKGAQTVSTTTASGGSAGQTVYDLASGLVTSAQTNLLDGLGRLQAAYYADGTFTSNNYNCCGLNSSVDRAGTITSNTYDGLKRVLTTTRAGITTSNVYDAESRILATVRIGTDGSPITLGTNSYDTAGRLLNSSDALGNITTNAYGFDSNGNPTHTIYYPDGSFEVDTQYGDGSNYRVTGTAVAGVEYDYGVDGNGAYTLETKLATNGSAHLGVGEDLQRHDGAGLVDGLFGWIVLPVVLQQPGAVVEDGGLGRGGDVVFV
jgi:YD repeat-containing protein